MFDTTVFTDFLHGLFQLLYPHYLYCTTGKMGFCELGGGGDVIHFNSKSTLHNLLLENGNGTWLLSYGVRLNGKHFII